MRSMDWECRLPVKSVTKKKNSRKILVVGDFKVARFYVSSHAGLWNNKSAATNELMPRAELNPVSTCWPVG